jgi:hypothetical protein
MVAPDDEAVQTELRSGARRFLYRAPQPNQSLPGAALRPSNRDMRGSPDKGGSRGMRGGAAARIVREGGLAAIVSDAPEKLRARRRDLETHSATSQSSIRDMRGRGMRGMGGGRMNGGGRGRR